MFSQLLAQATGTASSSTSSNTKPHADLHAGALRRPGTPVSIVPMRAAPPPQVPQPSSATIAGAAKSAPTSAATTGSTRLGELSATKVDSPLRPSVARAPSIPAGLPNKVKQRPTQTSSSTTGAAVAAARKTPNFLQILKEAEKVDSERLKMSVKVRDPKKKAELARASRIAASTAVTAAATATAAKLVPAKSATAKPMSSTTVPTKMIPLKTGVKSPPPRLQMTAASKGQQQKRSLAKEVPPVRAPVRTMSTTRPSLSGTVSSKTFSGTTNTAIKARKDVKTDTMIKNVRRPASASQTATFVRPRIAGAKAGTPTKQAVTTRRPAAPAPFAKPMDGLIKKKRRAKEDESDSSLDDFIVSDEDGGDEDGEGRDLGYDPEEIRNLFRRNNGEERSYSNYDDDDDDMEASGFDVLREEQRSLVAGRREDERELEAERRRAEAKNKRLKRN
ncbi:SPT2 chromatin protein-domain-containing protein [Limtongia smithiae]|uniref:SPT2 chromatin protein-domain-containing protein n=1 Tax=Limtongia smithiae TaxID=1125753 RepID=UPI0034CD960C